MRYTSPLSSNSSGINSMLRLLIHKVFPFMDGLNSKASPTTSCPAWALSFTDCWKRITNLLPRLNVAPEVKPETYFSNPGFISVLICSLSLHELMLKRSIAKIRSRLKLFILGMIRFILLSL